MLFIFLYSIIYHSFPTPEFLKPEIKKLVKGAIHQNSRTDKQQG